MVSLPNDPEDSKTASALAKVVRPIHGDEELDQLLDLIGDARIVLLGEATHGTHEFYDLRARLTKKLFEDRSFSAMAIEGDWPDALRVDRYVRRLGDDDSAEAALSDFQRFPIWMWRNEEVASLVEWMRDFNRSRIAEQRVGFYGLDLYSLHASMRAVLSYLEDTDPEAAKSARERYACFDHAGDDPQRYGMNATFRGQSCEEEVIAQLVEMQRRRAARSGRSPSGDSWFHAMQNAHVVKDAEAYYRMMFAGRTASWNLRDTHMADTLDMISDHLAIGGHPARIVVWAHNSHVGDARATEMGDDGQLTLGQLVRQRHADQVALVGFTTHHGTVECAHDWDEPPKRERVRPSLAESWERVFHDTGIERFMVTSAALRRAVGEGTHERLHRAIGVVYRPETERRSHYYDARISAQYDIVVHVDQTRAVSPLDGQVPGKSADETHEMPETYPTGI